MRSIAARPTAMAIGIVILLFGLVWALSASDLSFGASFLVAVVVAAGVGAGIRFSRMKAEPGERGSRLKELMQRSTDARRGIRDDATGLLNRWYLERRLEEEAARCDRYGYSMAVVVLKVVAIDLARFSLDGWQAESAEAAQRCARVIRNVDLSASLAPFEFALCLVHCDRPGAEAAIERITTEFRDYECRIGISVYPDYDCEPKALIELARVRSIQVDEAA